MYMTQSKLNQLKEMTTTQLKEWYESQPKEMLDDLEGLMEDHLLTSNGGNYKEELLWSNLSMLYYPEEGDELEEYTPEGEQLYETYWYENYQKKMQKSYQNWGGPWKQGDTYYTQNPWCKTYWELDEEGQPTNLKTQYKYLPGPLSKENWNQYEWEYGLTGPTEWNPK